MQSYCFCHMCTKTIFKVFLYLNCRTRTCAKEEHLVVAVSGHDLVHSHCRVFIISIRTNHQGSPPHRIDGVKHYRMVADKGHHIIWELLCCLNVRCEGSTRTLQKHRAGLNSAKTKSHSFISTSYFSFYQLMKI